MRPPTPKIAADGLVYRSPPAGPSPRWRRSAAGLRWLRHATWAAIALRGVATLASALEYHTASADLRARAGSVMGAARAADLLVSLASAVALWRFGEVPASTGAAAHARRAFWFFVAMLGFSHLVRSVVELSGRPLMAFSALFSMFVVPVVALALPAAYTISLVRALGTALRSVGAAPPRWSSWYAALFIAWSLAGSHLSAAVVSSLRLAPANMVTFVAMSAVDAGFACALVALLGHAERVLERQEGRDTRP